MRVALFYHSLRSCWNHGNAHFLRGIASELLARGHSVAVYEPEDSWSAVNLVREHGQNALESYRSSYPALESIRYNLRRRDFDETLSGCDLVLVHEWNSPELVSRLGRIRDCAGSFRLLFHDTHHRSITAAEEMSRFDLSRYDGILAFGEAVRQVYLDRGWSGRSWTWHEAADTRVFRPLACKSMNGDLVWIGNWGDDERAAELQEFLMDPVQQLGLQATVHGVRYPEHALTALKKAGIHFRGWFPNHLVPQVFARHRFTIHVPRGPYARALPGIPTIRVFEALACGIPLVCAPWDDAENLFRAGADYLTARNGAEMQQHMRALLHDRSLSESLARHGLETIRSRHTCGHRVDELIGIAAELGISHQLAEATA